MSDNLEQIKLELNARLEEYKALRAEIVATLTAAYNTTTLTLTGTGVLIAGAPFILQSQQKPFLFLIASLVFYSIALTQVRYEQAVFNMSNHIIKVVTPAIRKAIKDAGSSVSNIEFDDVLSWEKLGRSKTHSSEKKFYPTELSRYLVPLLTGCIATAAYFFTVWQKKAFDVLDGFMIGVSVVGLLYSCYITYEMRLRLRGGQTDSKSDP